jgi:hypothetical protein
LRGSRRIRPQGTGRRTASESHSQPGPRDNQKQHSHGQDCKTALLVVGNNPKCPGPAARQQKKNQTAPAPFSVWRYSSIILSFSSRAAFTVRSMDTSLSNSFRSGSPISRARFLIRTSSSLCNLNPLSVSPCDQVIPHDEFFFVFPHREVRPAVLVEVASRKRARVHVCSPRRVRHAHKKAETPRCFIFFCHSKPFLFLLDVNSLRPIAALLPNAIDFKVTRRRAVFRFDFIFKFLR